LVRLVLVESEEHTLHKGEKPLRPGQVIFQMDGGTIAGLEDLPNYFEPGLEVKPSAHDDVVNVSVGECLPYIVHPSAAEEVDIRHLELPLHVVNNGRSYAEK
jgi:hypothetical protein